MAGPQRTPRRHPSAGNLTSRPTLVEVEGQAQPLAPRSFPHGDDPTPAAVRLGPDLDHETLAKLIGPLQGARVLDLGCGTGSASIAMAAAGARVIAVDTSTARLARARNAAELAEVHVEFHHSDLADLAFIRADSIDAVLAVYSLSSVRDLPRVFRQLHRVLSPHAPVVLSLPHPLSMMLEWDPEEQEGPWLARTAWSEEALPWRVGGDEGSAHIHQISAVFTALQRCNFQVDTLLEPVPEPTDHPSAHRSPLEEWVPSTVILRARKLGI